MWISAPVLILGAILVLYGMRGVLAVVAGSDDPELYARSLVMTAIGAVHLGLGGYLVWL